ncbi:hypothetical protein SNEBB_002729, partial [Seison nebaliae]
MTNDVMNEKKRKLYTASGKYSFHLDDIIGRGAFSRVYLSYDKNNNQYATKIFSPIHDEIFKKENELMKQLKHEHIIQWYDFDIIDKMCNAIIMEYSNLGSLQKMLKTSKCRLGLNERFFVSFTGQFVSAYNYMVEKDVRHRDLKPGNILLFRKDDYDRHGVNICLKFTDFGQAKQDFGKNDFNSFPCGTPAYAHPDILNEFWYQPDQQSRVDTEFWSIGTTFYQMATGLLPFELDRTKEKNSNRNRLVQLKKSRPFNAISGYVNEKGETNYSTELPAHCTYSRQLKRWLINKLNRLFEVDDNDFLTPKQFEQLMESFIHNIDVSYQIFPSTSVHHLYMGSQTTINELIRLTIRSIKSTYSSFYLFWNENKFLFNSTDKISEIFPDVPSDYSEKSFSVIPINLSLKCERQLFHQLLHKSQMISPVSYAELLKKILNELKSYRTESHLLQQPITDEDNDDSYDLCSDANLLLSMREKLTILDKLLKKKNNELSFQAAYSYRLYSICSDHIQSIQKTIELREKLFFLLQSVLKEIDTKINLKIIELKIEMNQIPLMVGNLRKWKQNFVFANVKEIMEKISEELKLIPSMREDYYVDIGWLNDQ